jgi:AcrR family transcriptional regulator
MECSLGLDYSNACFNLVFEMKRKMNAEDTRERIVRAAGEVFGLHGFDGTTIRQITKRAGVNVAAVNYHFRDKAELYLRVLREAKGLCAGMATSNFPGAPEEKLRGFIGAFVSGLLDPTRPTWHRQVITQEMIRPTAALDTIVRELTEPIFRQLRALIGEVIATKVSDTKLDMLAASVLGQCLFYMRSQAMLERLAPNLANGNERIAAIADHISTFTLGALCHLYQKSPNKPVARRSAATNRGRTALLAS